jgi:hypothetical protein
MRVRCVVECGWRCGRQTGGEIWDLGWVAFGRHVKAKK